MPELPDITIYLEALDRRILGQPLTRIRIASPFLLRTAVPPIQQIEGRRVVALQRLGKRIVFGFEDDLWLVLHLMIAGRLHWFERGAKPPGRNALAVFEFPSGTLTLTEAGTKKRASLHLVQGEAAQTSTMRWQDYTQTAVDPSDDCTIWYVGDYVKKDASSYSTRIGAFRIPGCTP